MDQEFWNNARQLLDKISPLNIKEEELKLLSCCLCKKVMVNSCQITCGCQFCRSCIEEYLKKGGRTCPIQTSVDCSKLSLYDMSDVHSETDSMKKIIRIMSKCPVKDCAFESQLIELTEHWVKCRNKIDAELEIIEQPEKPKNKITIKSLVKKVSKLKKNKEVLERTVKDLNSRINTLENEKCEDALKFDRLMFAFDRLEEQINENKYEPYVWYVGKFSQYKANDNCLYSEPFFVFKNGYKMRLLMYPNGAFGENEFVSVYFEILRGPYDMLLKWPFRYNVTLSVVSPDGQQLHSHTVFYLHHRSRHYVYQRPQNQSNVGLGLSRFIEYSRLSEPSNLFFGDDTLCLMCSVVEAPSAIALVDAI